MKISRQFGALPKHHISESEIKYMLLETSIKVLSKKINNFKAQDGTERESYRITFSQENDEIVGDINVKKEIYDFVEKARMYDLTGEYRTTRNGNFISWISVKPSGNANKNGI
jgi:vesicle coat complex subunit